MIERQMEKSHTHAVGFGGEEGVEQPVRILGRYSEAAIRHAYEHLLFLVLAGADHQFARPIHYRLHCFNPVHHQVDHHLLQLDPITQIMDRVGTKSVSNDTRWLINSCCTREMISLTTSLTSSGTFSMLVLFASARTRRITSLARLPVVDDP